ncbi:hypothetical protein G7Y79_00013g034960 [Physcia stellaris]|nr:hypothetical protein G7Y79_00013g034960 [Physcia stellaris]
METPVAIVCVGMAGSGKTTFMQRINSYLHSKRQPPYLINLDPAVRSVPFDSNIDIRDSLNYKEVMREYNLGPNGGILTSLNIFATKIDQVMGILEKRTLPNPETPNAKKIKNIIVDTPGQIEVILYKTKLPMILVFNKTDVKDADFAKEWMTDFESFQAALKHEEDMGSFGGVEGTSTGLGGGSGYMGSLLNSMSLMLEEFYRHLRIVPVSSMTGKGIDEFFEAVAEKAGEFEKDYKPELEKRRKDRQQEKESKREKELGKLMEDMNVGNTHQSSSTGPGVSTAERKQDLDTMSDAEDELGSDEGGQLVEPDEDEDSDMDGERPQSDGLEQRYKKALADGASNDVNTHEDNSFTRYLRASQIS